jgi:pSer/pThr/pTyr-binding forkhead associated (FHA) protein
VPFIEFQQRLFRLKDGENLLGADEQADITLTGLEAGCRLAICVEGYGAFALMVDPGQPVAINGHPLSNEPIPLFHGDKLSINGSKLVYIDDGGEATVQVPPPVPAAVTRTVIESDSRRPAAVEPELMRRVTPPEPERKVVAVLRRLDNSQSYVIDRAGFRIGREKRSDLIIPDRRVSRLHAEITFNRGSYLLRDLGRTATKVNGRKIDEPYKLQVGDVLTIRSYEFAFLRRPETAEDIVRADEITPVRGAVPDAITVERSSNSARVFSWLIFLVVAGTAALLLLT